MVIRRKIPMAMLACMLGCLLVADSLPVYSQTMTESPPVLRIRVRDVDRLLQGLTSLSPAGNGTDANAQTAIVRGLFQGTDWIDPVRSLVADLDCDGRTASWRVLIPFRQPNEGFRKAYGAVAGDDYYLLRFPPDPEQVISERERDDMLRAAAAAAEVNIEVALAAQRGLQQSEPRIEAALHAMAAQAAAAEPETSYSPEELQLLVRDLMAAFKQVETLRLGLDIASEALLLMDVKAVEDSFLAGLLVDSRSQGRLKDYRPDYPLRFRSRAYNVTGAVQLLGASFGQFYRQMGFDFAELAEVAKGLTGEMAGGMALDRSGMAFEMVYVLHPTENEETYLTRVYLPWFETYNRRMTSLMEDRTGQPVTPLYERLPDTTVAGERVIHVRTRFPAVTPAGNRMPANAALQAYQTRLAAVDNLILMASSDAAMERLIASAPTCQPTPAHGPLAEFSMDIGAYLSGLQVVMAPSDPGAAPAADIGDLTLSAEIEAGRLRTRTRVDVQDIQRAMAFMGAFSARAAAALTGESTATMTADPTPAAAPPAPASGFVQTPAYWMDRGGLLSAYGNHGGAVRCYRKALTLAPELPEAHFQLGVAYGELGQFAPAIDAISRAIERMPTNGAYFYGRGRVYLLAGEAELAMQDFMEAGFLGNENARAYLEAAGVSWN